MVGTIENENQKLIGFIDDEMQVLVKKKSGNNDILEPSSEVIEQKVKKCPKQN